MLNKQQIIQSICFEVGALFFFIFIFAPLLGYSSIDMGVLGAGFSLLAVTLLYFYNQAFDKTLIKLTGSAKKTVKARLLHASMFEAVFLCISLPVVKWWLQITLVEVLILEAAAIVFMLAYTVVFHWLVERYIVKKY